MKSIIALTAFIALLAGITYMTYTMLKDRQYKYSLRCGDIAASILSMKADAASLDSRQQLRYEAVKLAAISFAEARTALPQAELTPDLMAVELNELNYMCMANPAYNIGKISAYAPDRYYGERSKFNTEFSGMLGNVQVYQNARILEIGRWLGNEMNEVK